MDMQDHNPGEDDFDDSIVDDVIDSNAPELPAFLGCIDHILEIRI